MIDVSAFHIHSLGRVAKDILEDELYVDVFPIELQPGKEGELTVPEPIQVSGGDIQGDTEDIVLNKTTLLTCKWLPIGDTNRLEPPTVCKGETVLIYRYANTDKYFWVPIYNELKYRKLEKRTLILSNKTSIEGELEDIMEKTYYLTMDTINKFLRLHTDDSDGEYTTYDIEINTADGYLTIIDGKGNEITLDSVADKLTITTNEDIETNTTNKTHNTSENLLCNSKNSTTNVEESKVVNTDTLTENSTTSKEVNTGELTQNVDGSKSENIGARYDINLKSFSVNNGSDELIAVLSDFVQASSDALGIGNLGAPVPNDGGTMAAYAAIKAKLDGFK